MSDAAAVVRFFVILYFIMIGGLIIKIYENYLCSLTTHGPVAATTDEK
ncbi:hypothetical protein [Syntrophomonas wolfei]|nr:hypothetical protein [Syntrophomonas wolfei]